MDTTNEQFVLRTTLTSPFGRKIRMAADVLGLSPRVTILPADVYDPNDSVLRQNPLGKMPCLLRADGTAVFDSKVIVEFLQEVATTDQLFPLRGPQRIPVLTRAALADGIIEAGGLVAYESRWHAPEHISEPWMAHQRGKIARALAAFEAEPPAEDRTDAVVVGVACALEFLDRRKPMAWREDCPRLVRWFDAMALREPAFDRIKAGD